MTGEGPQLWLARTGPMDEEELMRPMTLAMIASALRAGMPDPTSLASHSPLCFPRAHLCRRLCLEVVHWCGGTSHLYV